MCYRMITRAFGINHGNNILILFINVWTCHRECGLSNIPEYVLPYIVVYVCVVLLFKNMIIQF